MLFREFNILESIVDMLIKERNIVILPFKPTLLYFINLLWALDPILLTDNPVSN